MRKKSYAIIGLGQFGRSIVTELVNKGETNIIAIDSDEMIVKKMGQKLANTFVADGTDVEALENLGIKEVDTAIVAFGTNYEATIVTTAILHQFEIPNIIARADDSFYEKMMYSIGATQVVSPEKESGINLADRLGKEDYTGSYNLDEKFSVVAIQVKESLIPKKIKDLNTRDKYGINIVLVKRDKKSFVPGGSDFILPNDVVHVVGTAKDIAKFSEELKK